MKAHRIRWPGAALLLAVSAVTAPVPSAATVFAGAMSLEQLTKVSDLVVHGTVESIESVVEGKQVFTHVGIAVTEVFKGDPVARRVTLKIYGGLHRGRRTFIVGGPRITRGEELVTFLRAVGPSTYDVVRLAEGKFDVVREGGRAAVRRDVRGIGYLRRADAPKLPETLEELRAAVRAAEH